LNAAASLPGLGSQAGPAADLLAAGQDTTGGLVAMCTGIRPLLDAIAADHNGENDQSGQLALQTLERGRPDLEAARIRLASARQRLERLDPSQLEALGPDAMRAAGTLRDQVPRLEIATETLLVLPTLLGGPDGATYLVLAQNSDELRATGGFVGTAGLMRVKQGRVVEFTYGSSTDLDLPSGLLVPPPSVMARYLRSNYWQLRDANWWPDFPSSVAQVEYFYQQLGKPRPDNVLAIDQTAVELLLESLGAVDVPEYGEKIDAANMRQRLDAYTHTFEAYSLGEERKKFVGALSAAVLKALVHAPPKQLLGAGAALRTALDEKHMLIYSHDPQAAALVAQAGWDGALLPADGRDFLYVTHSNVIGNKLDPEVGRVLQYHVQSDGSVSLRVQFKNHAEPRADIDARWTHYRDYLRVYVPSGATLHGGSGFAEDPSSAVECGRTMFSGIVELAPRETQVVELRWRLPEPLVRDLAAGSYALTVQKQPGTAADDLSVSVDAARLERSLDLDRFLQLQQGRLVAAPRPPASAEGSAFPAQCAIYDIPPRVLPPPERVVIEKAGVDASLVELGVDPDGTMQIPSAGDVVGWYSSSAYPGWPGNAVLAGHVDWQKKLAVFSGLKRLVAGDEIRVLSRDGTWQRYIVQENSLVPFDTPASRVVGPTPETRLTLITCDGDFDSVAHNYLSRRVVIAKLAAQ
jgi:hypothetical protein